MLRSRRRRLETERGQILVIVAGGLIALLAIAALALEGGTLVLNRRDAQNSADLASLAGARMVALNYTDGGRTQAEVYGALTAAPSRTTAGHRVRSVRLGRPVRRRRALVDPRRGHQHERRAPVGRHRRSGRRHPLAQARSSAASSGSPPGRSRPRPRRSVSSRRTSRPASCCRSRSAAGARPASTTASRPPTRPRTRSTSSPGQTYDITDGKDAPGGFGWLSWTGSNSAGALSDSICNAEQHPVPAGQPVRLARQLRRHHRDQPGDR